MNIDSQTLKDLEIFKTEEKGISVYDFLFKTQTTGGEFRLREKFRHPPTSLKSVLEHQETIVFLVNNIRLFYLPYNDHQMKSLEEYLSTNIEVVKDNRFIESFRFWITDINAFHYIKYSLQEVIAFTSSFYKVLYDKKDHLPVLLRKAFDELDQIFHSKEFRDIIQQQVIKKHSIREILVADRVLRTYLKPNIIRITAWYYELDALLAMAKVTHHHHFAIPIFSNIDDVHLVAEGLYHPLLKNAVPVDPEISKDRNFVFLTGPNMSGKTTFLKSLGLAVYFAHLGMGVPASRFELKYFDRLFTSITIRDNILAGYSFFYSEVARIKELGAHLNRNEKVCVIFDELFRGTNVTDAYDSTILIIEKLVQWKSSIFVVSSHLLEVWNKISHFKNIQSVCFESFLKDEEPVFTFKLLSGGSNLRLGLKIIQKEGLTEPLQKKDSNDYN